MQTNQTRQPETQPAQRAPLTAQAPRKSGGSRGRIALAAALAIFGASSTLTLTGCPANLQDAERFDDAGTPAVTDPNAAPTCLTQAFSFACGSPGCHDPTSTTLNLVSPDVAGRLVNVTAKHALLDPSVCPSTPVKYIDTSNPSASWILAKLGGTQGTCGLQMPETNPQNWTADDLTCLTNWIQTLSGASSSGGGSGGGAATTGGSGGAATSSGGTGTASGGGGASSAGAGGTANGASGSAGTGGA